nr:reverse transcriptase domain-containing protein [Tanacetum cinerariifolium]
MDGQKGERSGDQEGSGRGSQGSGRGSQGCGRDGQESDQDSQGSSRGNIANGGGGGVPDFATIIAQQLQNLLPTIIAQVGNYVKNQGNNEKQDDNVINDNNQGYKGKGGMIVYTRWIEKMESVQDMSGCGENQKVKYTFGSFICKALTRWNSQVQTRGREATVGMTWEDFKTLTREELCLNNEMQKHIARDCRMGTRVVNSLNARNMTAACGVCFECGGTDHYKAACPRLNKTLRPGGNHPNPVMAIEGGKGHEINGNQARGRDFVMGSEEARQDPNIMTGTFTLNSHYATTLFNSGANYNFVSTTFIPLLDIEPDNLGLSYEIKIASGQLVEINKGWTSCPGTRPILFAMRR